MSSFRGSRVSPASWDGDLAPVSPRPSLRSAVKSISHDLARYVRSVSGPMFHLFSRKDDAGPGGGDRAHRQALTRHSALTSTGHCAAQLQPYDQTHSVPACNSHFLADSAHWPHHTSATHTVADTGRTTPTGGARPGN